MDAVAELLGSGVDELELGRVAHGNLTGSGGSARPSERSYRMCGDPVYPFFLPDFVTFSFLTCSSVQAPALNEQNALTWSPS
jgi:hypothetical protein